MQHSHHNHGCDHSSVKYCKLCDLAYCTSCSKEWGGSRLVGTIGKLNGQLGLNRQLAVSMQYEYPHNNQYISGGHNH